MYFCLLPLLDFQGRKCLAVFSGGLKGELPVQDRNLYLLDTAESKWQTVDVKIDQLTNELPFASQPPSVQGHVMTGVGSKVGGCFDFYFQLETVQLNFYLLFYLIFCFQRFFCTGELTILLCMMAFIG